MKQIALLLGVLIALGAAGIYAVFKFVNVLPTWAAISIGIYNVLTILLLIIMLISAPKMAKMMVKK